MYDGALLDYFHKIFLPVFCLESFQFCENFDLSEDAPEISAVLLEYHFDTQIRLPAEEDSGLHRGGIVGLDNDFVV